MVVWVEGLDRGEADQRPAPMTVFFEDLFFTLLSTNPVGKLRVYCLKTLNKLSIYPLGNTPSAPSELSRPCVSIRLPESVLDSGCLATFDFWPPLYSIPAVPVVA